MLTREVAAVLSVVTCDFRLERMTFFSLILFFFLRLILDILKRYVNYRSHPPLCNKSFGFFFVLDHSL